jgi:hypothetical protein
MLALARAIIGGKGQDALNSRAAEKTAQSIIEVMVQHGTAATDVFNRIVTICRNLGDVTPDHLKRQAILTEMLTHV